MGEQEASCRSPGKSNMQYRILLRLALLALPLLVVPPVIAQNSGDPAGTRRANLGVDPLGSRSTSPGINTQPEDAPRMSKGPRFQFVSGTVVQDDGSPPPPGAFIERICSGKRKREAEVDAKGRFSFQVGVNNELPDASDDNAHAKGALWNRASQSLSGPYGVGSASYSDLMGCELAAQLVGYRSSRVSMGQFQSIGDIDVGTIVLHPAQYVRGTTVSITSMWAPKPAKKAYARAENDFRKKKIAETLKDLELAVEIYPKYAAAWFEMGQIFQQQHRTDEARRVYLKSVEADVNFIKPYIELARIAQSKQKWLEVADITGRALELDPLDFCEAYFLNSIASYTLGRFDDAERAARKALRLDGAHRFTQAYLILANVLYRNQDVAGAVEQMRAFLKFAPSASNAAEVRARLQELDKEANAAARNQPSRN